MARRVLLTVFFIAFGLISQIVSAFSKDDDKISLSSSDKGKIEKAEGLRKKSDKAMQDADKAYADIAAKQADLTSEESDKLNNKALEKQIDALKIRKQGNDLEYNIYASKADEFWKKFKGSPDQMGYAKSLESEAKLKYQSANEQFKEADKTDDKLISYSKMTTASELLANAVSSMKLTFETYANTSLITGISESSQVQIKQDTIPKVKVDTTSTATINAQTVQSTITPDLTTTSVAVPNVDTAKTSVSAPNTYIDTTKSKPVTSEVSSASTITSTAIVAPVVEPTSTLSVAEPVIIKADTAKVETAATTMPQTQLPEAKTNLYQAVKVNEDMIDRFNKFLKTQYPKEYENYIIDFNGLDYSDVDAIKAAWYNYLYGNLRENQETLASENKIDSTTISKVDSGKTAYNNEIQNIDNNSKTQSANNRNKKFNKSTKNKEFITNLDNITEEALDAKYSDTSAVAGFSFTVQIAASRVPLKRKMQVEIYNGSETIDENLENEWYKYSIGPFRTYRQAREFREKSGVLGAFVIVFVHGHKVNANEALVTPQHIVKSGARKYNIPEGVMFKVQIAACRHELVNDELVKIYSNISQVENNFEDGWYKYMIDCGSNYEKAIDLLKSVKVAGAFIAVYKNGARVKLKDIYN